MEKWMEEKEILIYHINTFVYDFSVTKYVRVCVGVVMCFKWQDLSGLKCRQQPSM